MEEDKFALVEKIILDVHNVMDKNAELLTFDIVPADTNFQNKSPVLYLENCLGLESWCVKHVYMYCYSEIMDKYFAKPKRKALRLTAVNCDRLCRLLNLTLLLNPELSSFWNKRRSMALKSSLNKLKELRFTRLVLSRKPKSNDAFAYRRWLLEGLLKDEYHQNNLQNLITEELLVCELTADSSPNNYHSWNHRIWLLKILQTTNEFDLYSQYVKEYEFSERWIAKHVSDYSCFHYRQFCIGNVFTIDNGSWQTFADTANTNLRKEFVQVLAANFPNDTTIEASQDDLLSYSRDNLVKLLLCHSSKNCNCTTDTLLVNRKLEVLFHELIFNNELLRFYKHHETLWYHRRFIVHEIIVVMYSHFGVTKQNGALVKNSCRKCNFDDLRQKQAKIIRYDSNRIYSSILFNILLSHEKKLIEERRIDGDNYADRHEKYLKFVEGLNNVL